MRKRTQQERSAETSGRILSAAQQLFAQRGFDGVSMRDIAGAAGVNIASIVYYFENKEGVFMASIAQHALPLMELRMGLFKELDINQSASLEDYIRGYFTPAFDLMQQKGGQEFTKLLWRLPHEPVELWNKANMLYFTPARKEFVARIRSFCDSSVSAEDFSWIIHVVATTVYATMGKCAEEERWQKELWMKDKDAVVTKTINVVISCLQSLAQPTTTKRKK